jgi:hypothetical protein
MADQKDVLAQCAPASAGVDAAYEKHANKIYGHNARPLDSITHFYAGWNAATAALTPAATDIVDRLEADTRSAAHCAMSEEAAVEIKRLRALVESARGCAKFVKWALLEGSWSGADLDGGCIQDTAEELGLIQKVPYDPDKHGDSEFEAEPGDDWFVLTDAVAALSDTSTVRGGDAA